NGGQYTHAAVWLALACYELGMSGEGYEILQALLPEKHDPGQYQAEPHVIAADVYANPQHLGRGGWSWYTGAAGWYLQTALSGLLGLQVKGGALTISPQMPAGWAGFSLQWRSEQWNLHIAVRRGETAGMRMDETPVEDIPLQNLSGEHRVEVTVVE
ncbi:MAG: hypothetical protein PUC36_06135, partial [Clostridiales bacterium]|nr:hypothetical protein [Clostridiales bacterium]